MLACVWGLQTGRVSCCGGSNELFSRAAFNPRDIALVTSKDEETKKLNKKLWEALDSHDAAAVEEYLEKGAQVNYKKWVYGVDLCFTPLHFAVFNSLPEIMKVLFKYNCDVLLRTPAGEIAKDLAIEKDDPDIIDLLEQLTEEQEEERMAYIEKFGEPDPEKHPAVKYGIFGAGHRNIWKEAVEAK